MNRDGDTQQKPLALRSDRIVWVAFGTMVLFGGSNALAVRFTSRELPPFWGASLRFGVAGLVFWTIVLALRIPLPRGRGLLGAVLYGLFGTGMSFALFYWGLQYVQAGFAMVILALAPLLTLFLEWVHHLEKLSWRRLAGALLAVAGILIVAGGGPGSAVPIAALLALVTGAACSAEGSVVVKLSPPNDPAATNAVALTTGALVLLGLSVIAGEAWVLPVTIGAWLAFSYLIVFGSVVMFYLYLFVLARRTASATAYSFLLFPLVTVPLAALLTGEVITLPFILGGALGLFGVWLGAIAGPPRVVPSAAAPATDYVVG